MASSAPAERNQSDSASRKSALLRPPSCRKFVANSLEANYLPEAQRGRAERPCGPQGHLRLGR